MTIRNLYPNTRPSATLDFVKSKRVDPRILTTRNSLATYFDNTSFLVLSVPNSPRLEFDQETNECIGVKQEEQKTNYVHAFYDPTDTTNLSLSGDIDAVLTVEDDSVFLLSCGIGKLTKKAYKLDNSLGSTSAVVTIAGEFDSTDPIALSAYIRGAGVCKLQTANITLNDIPLSLEYKRYETNTSYLISGTPSATDTVEIEATAGSVVYFCLVQAEDISTTSYIPTSGSSYTRAQEVLSIDGSLFSNIWNSEATISVKAIGIFSNNRTFVEVNDGTSDQRISIGYDTTAVKSEIIDTTLQAELNTPKQNANNSRAAVAIKEDDFQQSANGQVSDIETGNVPTVNRLLLGSGSNYDLNGHIQLIEIYTIRLTSQELTVFKDKQDRITKPTTIAVLAPNSIENLREDFDLTQVEEVNDSVALVLAPEYNIPNIGLEAMQFIEPKQPIFGQMPITGVRNILVDTDVLATQETYVESREYTLSFKGTGSVALSESYTGNLDGTGADDIVELTFTAVRGTLELTVSGSVLEAQLETGDTRTAYQSVGENPWEVTESGIESTPVVYFDNEQMSVDTELPAGTYTVVVAGDRGITFNSITHAGGTWEFGPTTWTGGPPDAIRAVVGNRCLGRLIINRELSDAEKAKIILYFQGKGAGPVTEWTLDCLFDNDSGAIITGEVQYLYQSTDTSNPVSAIGQTVGRINGQNQNAWVQNTSAARMLYGTAPLRAGLVRNLLLATDLLATQNLTVTAAQHTLSFRGTGTVTLSGVSTAGPLAGTGADDVVSLTFTPTAGTLTLTVSGTVAEAQLNTGATRGAYQRVGTSRADVTQDGIPGTPILYSDLGDDSYPLTMPAVSGGTLVIATSRGIWVDDSWEFAGGTFTLGPTTWTGGLAGMFNILRDAPGSLRLLGAVVIDRALSEREMEQTVAYYEALGAPGVYSLDNGSAWDAWATNQRSVYVLTTGGAAATNRVTFEGYNGATYSVDGPAGTYDLDAQGLTAPYKLRVSESLSANTALQDFRCYTNQLTGSIPDLSANTALQQFWCNNNQLTGSIPDLSANTALQIFRCNSNQLTGTIPDLSANTALQIFWCFNNQLTGTIPDLSANTALQIFQCHGNQLTGTIPDLSANAVLQSFQCHGNQLTGWAGGTVSNTINNFQAANNNLSESAVNGLLQAFDVAGRTTGTLTLQGGTNAAPTGAGITAKNSLIAKGWTVNTN